jgi:hypothetical protein
MRFLLVAAGLVAGLVVGPAAAADAPYAGTPVEDYSGYQPQTTCTKAPKPGTIALGEYLVATYGGGGGAVNRSCTGSSTSEHKDGRAIDWTLDATSKEDRQRANQFLAAAFADDDEGNTDALARRMGIMYLIWDDHMYSAYDGFEKESYLSSSCRSKKRCSKTLRHRDHMHISLSKPGARGLTSFYAGLLDARAAAR